MPATDTMTSPKAKKDLRERLAKAKLTYDKLTARSVGFSDLGRATVVYVTIHGLHYNGSHAQFRNQVIPDLKKPSEGGYVVDVNNCKFERPVV